VHWRSAGAEHPEGGLLDGFCLNKPQAKKKPHIISAGQWCSQAQEGLALDSKPSVASSCRPIHPIRSGTPPRALLESRHLHLGTCTSALGTRIAWLADQGVSVARCSCSSCACSSIVGCSEPILWTNSCVVHRGWSKRWSDQPLYSIRSWELC
jgi:hypothetical protein